MKSIFNKLDFVLCKVPVPKGYPQSQTHAGIAMLGDKYILTTSPYPNPKYPKWKIYFYAAIRKLSFHKINLFYCGENFENPCVYIGENTCIPTEFKLIQGCPLMNTPENKYGLGSYCSDPDIYVEDNHLFVINRTSIRKSETGVPSCDYETSVYLISFDIEDGEVRNKSISKLFNDQDASPCLSKIDGKYAFFSLDTNSYNTGEPCKALYMRTSSNLKDDWSAKKTIVLDKGKYEPWHMSLFQYEGKLYAIVACIEAGIAHRCWSMLGEFSEDLSHLKIYKTPLTDYKSYRSAAIVREDGEFILYNTTVHEKIEGGKSVDGREVIMAHMPFNELLKKLRENE